MQPRAHQARAVDQWKKRKRGRNEGLRLNCSMNAAMFVIPYV